MTKDRWQKVAEVYDAAQDKHPEERVPFVRAAANGDSDLRRQVESLLAQDDKPVVLDTPIQIAVGEVLNDNPPVPFDSGSGHPEQGRGVQPGILIGPYRIDTLLGVGGMGEVYRARDTKLNRDVAIKILPPAFATDPDRLARFKREAQVLASLNHPNVGGIYGFEDGDGIHALILELVEGPTLAERLQASGSGLQHSLPIEEALAIARQIAEALEAAHEQGIIHRDLKPANIKVREDGTVKVLDFGLAKLVDPIDGPAKAGHYVPTTQSPTITTPAMTAAGMILGTAAYMSPEQAKGKPADKRSDIWAFGCVLYEMLTGRRAFDGEDVADTLANILKTEPDWQALPDATPQLIRRMLRRALAKDRKDRLGDPASLRLDIEEALRSPHVEPRPVQPLTRAPFLIGAAVGAILVAAATGIFLKKSAASPMNEMRLDITTPQSRELSSLALSPDGLRVAYVADADGQSMLWVRDLSTGVAQPVVDSSGARYPFWKPNGRSLGFFARGQLKRVDLAGGAPRDLAAAPTSGRWGGAWGRNGVILFVPTNSAGIRRVPEDGGVVTVVTQVTAPDTSHRAPSFLSDGIHFTYVVIGPPDRRGVYLTDVAGATPRRLFDADTGAVYADGHLLYLRNGMLMVQPFDTDRLEVSGEPFRIAEDVNFANGMAALTAATTKNAVAFRRGTPGDRRQYVWFNRSGQTEQALGTPDVGTTLSGVEVSPDGKQIAAGKQIDGKQNVWLFETMRGVWSRIASGTQPIWSPGGTRLAFFINNEGYPDLYMRPAGIEGADELLFSSRDLKGSNTWSPDSRMVLFNRVPTNRASDIWAVNVADKQARPVVDSAAAELDAQISADGRWIAYQSDQSGIFEIHVQPFLRSGRAVQVSTGGGAQVRWRKDGRELYYVDLTERLVAVPVAGGTAAETLEFGAPAALFPIRVPGGALQTGGNHQQYLPAADGQRFLVNTQLEEPNQAPITIILNWNPQSKASDRLR